MRRVAWFVTRAALAVTIATSAYADEPDEALIRDGAAVIDAMKSGDAQAIESRFAEPMRQALPHDGFVATLAQINARLGHLQSCEAPVVRSAGFTFAEYPCRFDKAPITLRLVWDQHLLTGLFLLPSSPPPAPPPESAHEEPVVVGAAGWPLPGTLLIPNDAVKPPIAVLVHGSGPNDRDETIGPNRVFRDLANGLAERGIATLRYDKRTRALGERFSNELKAFTLDDEVVDDAVAALVKVAGRDDLGPVFVVGHSEGAWLAPRIARRARDAGVPIAGVVMLSGNASPLADVLVTQYELLTAALSPRPVPDPVVQVKEQRDNVARLVATGHVEPGHEALPLGMPASAWLDIARYDAPSALLAEPGLPALLTFGDRDYQVAPSEAAIWQSRVGERTDTTIVVFPKLNHLLIEGEGAPGPAEYAKPGHVAGALIDRVAGWIGERSAPGR